MSETQYGRDLCATGRHNFEDDGACLRCGEAPPPAVPPTAEPRDLPEDAVLIASLKALVMQARNGGMVQLYRNAGRLFCCRLVRPDGSALEFGQWSDLRLAIAAGIGPGHVEEQRRVLEAGALAGAVEADLAAPLCEDCVVMGTVAQSAGCDTCAELRVRAVVAALGISLPASATGSAPAGEDEDLPHYSCDDCGFHGSLAGNEGQCDRCERKRLRAALEDIAHRPSYSIDPRDAFDEAVSRANRALAATPSRGAAPTPETA